MPLYEYFCKDCGWTCEVQLPVAERDRFKGDPCMQCGSTNVEKDARSLGGFRLGQGGSVGWSEDGYSTTYGDQENFKAGRKVY